MAMSPSPQLSPVMASSHRQERHDSPPAHPISKRDKRRTQLLDRLHDLTVQFTNNKDQYYRAQLQAIQLDTALILHAVPYVEDPTKDLAGELEALVYKITGGRQDAMKSLNERDLAAIGGKIYAEFQNEVVDAMERRDATLTMHTNDYKKRLADLHTSSTFMTKLAEEEHKHLSSTIRDRLINSVTGRKNKLNKDMSMEKIDDSNAHLLHPSHYALVNPSSPGGVLGKRATRHRRDLDDLPVMVDGGHKRKRRTFDETGSPGPSRRLMENGFSTPLWSSEQVALNNTKGIESPLYSIDKLFTEKELSMHYGHAAKAAHEYIVKHKFQESQTRSQSSADGNEDDEDNENPDSPPSAPAMDRQVSHNTRATRGIGGTTAFTTASGIEVLGDLSLPSTFSRIAQQMPKLPPPIASVMQRSFKDATANSTQGVSGDELMGDMNRIELCKRINATEGPGKSLDFEPRGDREFLAQALAEPGTWPVWLGEKKEEVREEYGVGNRRYAGGQMGRLEEEIGGTAMSRGGSKAGSEAGGVAMSRSNTNEGGRKGKGKGKERAVE